MPKAKDRLKAVRESMNCYEKWLSPIPKLSLLNDGAWQIFCGEGQFDPLFMNGARSKSTGVAMNFQITGVGEEVTHFEICVAWPDDYVWLLMFHNDPKGESWPSHPCHHIQFRGPKGESAAPFISWRLPFAETDPARIIEYLVEQIHLGG